MEVRGKKGLTCYGSNDALPQNSSLFRSNADLSTGTSAVFIGKECPGNVSKIRPRCKLQYTFWFLRTMSQT